MSIKVGTTAISKIYVGTTPVKTVRQGTTIVWDSAVAPPALNPNLVVNDNWEMAGEVSNNLDGTLILVNGTADQSFATTPGQTYSITASVYDVPISISVGTSTKGAQNRIPLTPLSIGSISMSFIAVSVTTWMRFQHSGASNTTGVVSDVALRKV